MRALRLWVVLTIVIGSVGWAQLSPLRDHLQTTVHYLISEDGLAAAASKMHQRGLATIDIQNGSIQVVIEATAGVELSSLSEALRALGGQVELAYESVIQARVPLKQLEAVAALPQVRFVRLPVAPTADQGTVVSEGVSLVGSRSWNSAGLDGKGVRVGILDTGFFRYEALAGQELPPRSGLVTRSFRRDGQMYNPNAPSRHGTALAEIVHDVAPGATLYLTAFATDVELRRAMDYLIGERVDVISTSFSIPSGCFTGPGIFEPHLRKAREAGIFWSTSGGNDGSQHWEGRWRDNDTDRLHNFQGADNRNDMDVELFEFQYPSGRRVATFVISGIFSWEADCQNAGDDYEIVFFDEQGRELSPFDEETGQGQVTEWVWRPGVPIKSFFATLDYPVSEVGKIKRVQMGIRQMRSGAPQGGLDIVWRCCDIQRFEYSDPRGSISVFEPRSSAHVFTIGAFAHDPARCPSWAPCPAGLFEYSSRGPTKDGRLKPDLTAPSHVSTASYGRFRGGDDQGFTGTSAAQPHVAGAAALIKQAFPSYGPSEIARFLESRAEDRGSPGKDNEWGAGQLVLGAAPVQNRPPLANAGPDQTVTVGSVVQLDGSRSSDPDGDRLSYSWRFVSLPPGSQATLSDPGLVDPTFVADVVGEYLLELTVDDGKGERASDQVKVTATLPTVLRVFPVTQALFVTPGWQRELDAGCVVYTPAVEARVQFVLSDGIQEHTVLAGRRVLLCGDLAHVESAGEPHIVVGSVATGARPLALKFTALALGEPARWERTIREGCMIYKNVRAESNAIQVTLSDGSVLDFAVAAGREAFVCGSVIHLE